MATYLLCAIAEEDVIKGATDSLIDGAGVSKDLTNKVKAAAAKIDEILRAAEKKMTELTDQIGQLGVESNNITKVAFNKYDATKKNLRISRRRLRRLAHKTKTASEELEEYLEGWDNDVDNGDKKIYLKEQLTIMENLMKDTLDMLGESENNYEAAIDDILGVNTKLRDFNRGVKKMLDTSSAEYDSWSSKVRAGAYTAAGSVSVGLIFADVFGCLGICSAVGNAVGWGTAVGIAESSIDRVYNKIKELEALGESVRDDITRVKSDTDELIDWLELEVDIIGRWKNNAENFNRKLDNVDISKFETLPLYKKSFSSALARLRESAEEYLAQPEQLWEDEETPTQFRSGKFVDILPSPITRRHKRRF